MWFTKKESNPVKRYFSDQWIEDWKSALDRSDDYKQKGKNWNAPLILKFDPVPALLESSKSIGFFLNLQYGECIEMRLAKKKDEDISDVILKADERTWIKLIEEKKDPTMFIMKGKLKLEKGSLVLLSTNRKAAKALLETAPVYSPHDLMGQEKSSGYKSQKSNNSIHKNFITTTKGLDFESFPMQLFQKAKVFGIWNPADINFSEDREQWIALTKEEKNIITHLSSLFLAGEEAVTSDILPLIQVIAREGRIEEEIFLTSFLWEEAKHTEFFSKFIKQVMINRPDFESFHGPFYKKLFYEKLPQAMNRLINDPSPLSQLKASATYNMIVEGTLAETGYEAYHKMLKENDLLPGMQKGIVHLKQDESRHIAYGLFLINRLLNENPDLKDKFEDELEELLNDATNIIHEIFEPYDNVPFGLDKEWFLEYAIKQFQNRMNKIEL
jgi:ribonucleotide reductase beta subunit family protein with ferritin-like domain/putative sterol carrier protein